MSFSSPVLPNNMFRNEVEEEKDSVFKLLEEVFENCIVESDTTDLVKNLIDLYASFATQGFESNFEEILMLTLSQSKRSNDVHKIFRFISECAVTMDNKLKAESAKKEPSEDDDEAVHPFLKYLFDVLELWSRASSYLVRYRSCQLLYSLLTSIQDSGVGELDETSYEIISEIVKTRRLDVSASVRTHAVLLAKFFQDPSTQNDPIIAGLCWQLQNDPNAHVRQNIVEILAACEETIFPVTKRFLYDKNAQVRNAALLHICNRISPRSYSTSQRILILNHCFSDTAAVVRQNAEKRLIPMWFRAYGDKLTVFLKSLHLENDCLDMLPFINDLIITLLKSLKISEIIEEIDLDTDTCLLKPPLTAEKVFVWRYFYDMACRSEKLKQFIPELDDLIAFISNYFRDTSMDKDQCSTTTELILFATDLIEIMGEEKCEKLLTAALDIMKNPFVSYKVMPSAAGFYCEYAAKSSDQVHDDILQVINELQKMIQLISGEEQKAVIMKCLSIIFEILSQENIILKYEDLVELHEDLIMPLTHSSDIDIKIKASEVLVLYCFFDLEEAKNTLSIFKKKICNSSLNLKCVLLKGIFDILKRHGAKLFCDTSDGTDNDFNEFLENMIPSIEADEVERSISLKGILKLYVAHHTWSPLVLARLIIHMFYFEEDYSLRRDITNFLQIYGNSRPEAECLTRSFLTAINLIFDSNKGNPFHKISIKNVALQLLEFSKVYEGTENFTVEDTFQDLLVIKITRKFPRKPWRLPALDLQEICEQIIPKNLDKLVKLKENVKLIIESLDSPIFLQKNPYSKKSIKYFSNYMKKIQAAMDVAPISNESNKNESFRENEDYNNKSFKRNEDRNINESISPIKPKNMSRALYSHKF